MPKGKGWFLESRRHKLSALGIKTGRKMLPKKPISLLVGDQKMFYPKKKEVSSIYEAPVEQIKKGFNKVYGRYPTDTELNDMLLEGSSAWKPFVMNYPKKQSILTKSVKGLIPINYAKEDEKLILQIKKKYPEITDLKQIPLSKAPHGFTGKILYISMKPSGMQEIYVFDKKGTVRRFLMENYGVRQVYGIVGKENITKATIKIVTGKEAWSKNLVAGFDVVKGKLDYTKNNNKGKKIVKGALIGAVVGALAYKKQPRIVKDLKMQLSIAKKGWKISGIRKKPKLVADLETQLEIAKLGMQYSKNGGSKKMKKKMNYDDDVIYDPVTAEPMPIPEKAGFFKKLGRGAVAVGRGAKATFEKGQEITAKLRKIQEEREAREMVRTQKQLLTAESQLQVVRAKKKLEATKKEIEAGRKSILPKIF